MMVDEAKQQLRRWERKIQAALKLFPSSADADGVIGELPDKQLRQYKMLLQACEAVGQMLWSAAQANGARKTDKVLRMWAQGHIILVNLIHYAFALGVQWGREKDA